MRALFVAMLMVAVLAACTVAEDTPTLTSTLTLRATPPAEPFDTPTQELTPTAAPTWTPVPTWTPEPTNTSMPTPTPAPTVTPTVTPTSTATPVPIDLINTDTAALWVLLTNSEYGRIDAYADPAFDVDVFDLDVFVDGEEFCNTSRIYGDEGPHELSCVVLERLHTSVQRVSVQTPLGDLRCARNVNSDASQSIFACTWRDIAATPTTPTPMPPSAVNAGPGLGLSRQTVTSAFSAVGVDFSFEDTPVDDTPRLTGTYEAPTGTVFLALVGPQLDLTEVRLGLLGVDENDIPFFSILLLASVLPEWTGASDWLFSTFTTMEELNLTEAETIHGDARVSIEWSGAVGSLLLMLSIERFP